MQDPVMEAFVRLFRGRADVFAKAVPKEGQPGKVQYIQVKEPMTLDHLERHFAGDLLLGQYQLLPDSSVYWFALDFDADDDTAAVLSQAADQLAAFEDAGLNVYLEQSRSGDGCHIWGFFDQPVPALQVRQALKPLLLSADSFDRLYPVQTTLGDGRQYGNLIALPFFGLRAPEGWNSRLGPGVPGGAGVFLNTSTLEPIAPEVFLDTVRTTPVEVLVELHKKAPKEPAPAAASASSDRVPVAYGEVEPKGRPEQPINGVLKMISDYGCRFMAHAFTERRTISEPVWYAALQQLTCFKHGRAAAHLISRDYAHYDPKETDAKFTQALRHPPVGCKYIHEHFPELACKGCVMKAPYQIGDRPILELVQETTEPLQRSTFQRSLERMRRRNAGEELPGVTWGTAGLDPYTRLRPRELTVVGSMPSVGKAQPLTAKVLTPTGWTTIGALKVGDQVIAVTGEATTVLGVFPQGEKEIYRVTMSDGASTECCDEHLWTTSTRVDRRSATPWRVRSLREIRSTLRRKDTGGPEHAIPVADAVQFAPLSEALPLDPYLLGVLLGDGCFRSRSYYLSNSEQDIRDRVEQVLNQLGDRLVHSARHDYRIVGTEGKGGTPSKVRQILEDLGLGRALSSDKFVPNVYLYASADERLALLRGLCDTDGNVTRTQSVEYSTSSPQLRDAVIHLVRSLGGVVSVQSRVPRYDYRGESREGQMSFRLVIRMPDERPCVSSAKHVAKLRFGRRRERRSITQVELVGRAEAQCIQVAHPSQLYVTDDFIVTHNTSLLVDAALTLAKRDIPVFVFSAETGQEGLEDRFLANMSGVDSRAIRGERMLGDEPWPITPEEIKYVEDAATQLARMPIYVQYTAANADLMLNLIEDAVLKHNIPVGQPFVVFYDYIQFASFQGAEIGRDERERLDVAVAQMKYLAKILRQPVVIFSQVRRDTEGDEEPEINWFKGTGRIEADADVAIILTGERVPGATAKRKLTIVKQREGDAGVNVEVILRQAISRFDRDPISAAKAPKKQDLFAEEGDDGPF